MRKSLLTLLAAVALVLVLAASAFVFLPKRGPTTHTKSVTIRYAGHDTAAGAAPGELTFWVTNHTSKKLFVVPLTIEVHMPAGWTT